MPELNVGRGLLLNAYFYYLKQIVMEQFIRLLIDCGMDPKDVDFVSDDRLTQTLTASR